MFFWRYQQESSKKSSDWIRSRPNTPCNLILFRLRRSTVDSSLIRIRLTTLISRDETFVSSLNGTPAQQLQLFRTCLLVWSRTVHKYCIKWRPRRCFRTVLDWHNQKAMGGCYVAIGGWACWLIQAGCIRIWEAEAKMQMLAGWIQLYRLFSRSQACAGGKYVFETRTMKNRFIDDGDELILQLWLHNRYQRWSKLLMMMIMSLWPSMMLSFSGSDCCCLLMSRKWANHHIWWFLGIDADCLPNYEI